MKPLPLNVQTFRKIIAGNYLYIDKTDEIAKLLQSPDGYYFLSRPRRFGKSLLISILEELFKGNQELFKGLYIYDKIEWKTHPVARIDFSKLTYKDGEELEKALLAHFDAIAKEYELSLVKPQMKERWAELIAKLYEKTQMPVVLLIDEYDAPINSFIDQPLILKDIQEVIREFYKTTKALDEYWRFVFVTGITKYAKLSLFSAINNITDISIHPRYHAILGISVADLEVYFKDSLMALEEKFDMSREALLEYIRWWYNGYSWNGQDKFCNPYSLLHLFDRLQFKNHWFTTGTPSLLIQQIKKPNQSVANYEQIKVSESAFESFEVEDMPLESLLWQTGYLTIVKIKESIEETQYTLSFPNNEVRVSFVKHILATYTNYNLNRVEPDAKRLKRYLLEENLDGFIRLLQRFIGGIPSKLHIQHEFYYHSLFYMILTLVGVKLRLEERYYKGDVDGVLEFKGKVYIIEFK
ncbi:MAG: AAA family ATPase, partial [Chitinophagales bacterium]